MQRYHIQGHIYFITTVTYARRPLFTFHPYALTVLENLRFYCNRDAMKLIGYVVMPDHMHFIVWPQESNRISAFMRDFKQFSAQRIIQLAESNERRDDLAAFAQASKETGRAQRKVWQDSYWDKNLYSDEFVRRKLNYIHRNPVRAGLVASPDAYAYSSYRNYVLDDDGLIEIDRGWS